jgi:hypothetical protein
MIDMNTLATLNIIGMSLTTIAAGMMYYYPPQGLRSFNRAGRPIFEFTDEPSPADTAKALRSKHLSRAAPAVLALGFGLQLLSAILQAA